jgi:hypothetical protein
VCPPAPRGRRGCRPPRAWTSRGATVALLVATSAKLRSYSEVAPPDAVICIFKINKAAVQGLIAGARLVGQVPENKGVVCHAAVVAEAGVAAGPQARGLGRLVKADMQHHVVTGGYTPFRVGGQVGASSGEYLQILLEPL